MPGLRLAFLDVCKVNGLFTLPPHLPSSPICKTTWPPDGAGLPSSQSAGSPVSLFLTSTPRLSGSLAYRVASRESLDSVTPAPEGPGPGVWCVQSQEDKPAQASPQGALRAVSPGRPAGCVSGQTLWSGGPGRGEGLARGSPGGPLSSAPPVPVGRSRDSTAPPALLRGPCAAGGAPEECGLGVLGVAPGHLPPRRAGPWLRARPGEQRPRRATGVAL